MNGSGFMCMALLFFFLFSILQYTDHSDLSISTSTPTPCYGDVVKLVCHHPEVVSNPGGYFDSRPTWREKGAAVVVVVADVKGTHCV